MASDLALVLPSAHRRLRARAERCGRPSRGMDDPVAELARELAAHAAAAQHELYRTEALSRVLPAESVNRLDAVARGVRAALASDRVPDPATLAALTQTLVEAEEALLLPVLDGQLPLAERRRLGKVFRLRRDAGLRSSGRRHHTPTHSELYERARRANVSHRSRMTVAELEQALRQQPGA